ncbi:MAG TPA: ABC transporter permease subunit [Verrucomicrobiae bacterium]|nr:ABC transporter permease subunit [Verrucomicrobiae bacterium]
MRNIWLICAKEMKAYFASPIAYAVLGLFSFLFGALVFYPTIRELSQMAVQMQMQGQPLNLNDQVIRPLLGFASTISLFVLPLITMRLFAEEKGSGTMELLLTSPVYDAEIILGKWLGAMLLYMSMLGMSVLNIMFLYFWGKPDWKPVLVAYLGLILQGGVLLGIGAFISSLTKSQVVAGGATFFVCLILWLLSWFTSFSASPVNQVLNYLSIVTHFDNFAKGVIDLKDATFYLTMIFFTLFITARSMESLRWRS